MAGMGNVRKVGSLDRLQGFGSKARGEGYGTGEVEPLFVAQDACDRPNPFWVSGLDNCSFYQVDDGQLTHYDTGLFTVG